jgi:predicted HAD superfamily Cof-like phosphohydrolase
MMNLFIEELEEFFQAAGFGFDEQGDPICVAACNSKGMLHEMVDMVYIIIDWALTYGWDFEEAFIRVHKANMSKVDPKEGIKVNPAGKIMKPEHFQPACLNNLVGEE